MTKFLACCAAAAFAAAISVPDTADARAGIRAGGGRIGGFRAGGFHANGVRVGGWRAGGVRVGGFDGVRAGAVGAAGVGGWAGDHAWRDRVYRGWDGGYAPYGVGAAAAAATAYGGWGWDDGAYGADPYSAYGASCGYQWQTYVFNGRTYRRQVYACPQ